MARLMKRQRKTTMHFLLLSSTAHLSRGQATTAQPNSFQQPGFPRSGIVFVIQVNLKGKCPGVGALGCLVISELQGTLPLCCHQRKDKGFGPGGPGKLPLQVSCGTVTVVLLSNIEPQMLGIKKALCPHDTLPGNTLGFVTIHSSNFHEAAITRKDTGNGGYLQ